MRLITLKAAIAAAFVIIPMVGAQAQTQVRYQRAGSADQVLAQADAAFNQISLDLYNGNLMSEDYRWLKDRVNHVRNVAIGESVDGMLPWPTYAWAENELEQIYYATQHDYGPWR